MDCSSRMWRFWFFRSLMALYVKFLPVLQNGSENDQPNEESDAITDLQDQEVMIPASEHPDFNVTPQPDPTEQWYHERLHPYIKWSFDFHSVLFAGQSKYQEITILNSKPFGKVLIIDGRLQTAECDEFVYHECLVHPALLIHPQPRSVFIMGGCEGSTAREVLKHRNIERVIMCEIDEVVLKQSFEFMDANRDITNDERLQIAYKEAKALLMEDVEEKFDVIVGNLGCCPVESIEEPCTNLMFKTLYEQVVKPKLNPDGIFVTQAGRAGVLSHKDMFNDFCPVYKTLKQVFNHVVAYTAHVPSYADMCGWFMASDDEAICRLDGEELNNRIGERISGELRYLDGPCIVASAVLNKTLKTSLMNEININ